MQLRYYQTEAIQAFYDYFEKYEGNPVAALPTGTGKSLVIAEFLRGIFYESPAERILVLTHVKELIEQNHAELIACWPMAPAGIYSAGLGKKEVRPITFAGIKSVVEKGILFGHTDLIIIDECHLISPEADSDYRSFIEELRVINSKVKVIGLTATPYRLGQGLLTEPVEKKGVLLPSLFTDICYDITGLAAFNRLIEEGFLCHLTPKKMATTIDVSEVKIRGGEFVAGELQAAVDKDEITYAACQEIIEQGANRKHWLIFGTGTKHCEHIVSCLESLGIPAACVHSKTSDADRLQIVKDFKSGKIRALVNNNIFTTGFNFKPVDLIAVLRPTSSPGLWVQMLGRGTRPSPETGKLDCLVLDFAGNTKRLGPINDPVIPRRKGSGEGGTAPVKLCPACGVYNHASVRICVTCQGEFSPPETDLKREASFEQLIVGASPQIEVYEVNSVNYRRYKNIHSNKPASLKIEYFCGYRQFSDWICLEHQGYPSKKARDWWRNASDDQETEPPKTVDAALENLQVLQKPTHIRVWVNQKMPRILAYDYSGTAFGTQKPELKHF